MSGYYSQMLMQRGGEHQLDLIDFRLDVLERYERDNRPWKLHRKEPGCLDGITFFYWLENYEDFAVLTRLSLSDGEGPSQGFIIAFLKDLASLPLSEQEHWRKHQG